ncbi:MAG: class I SAM-dependent methyltransferase [Sedimentisphaerales bacterium]|nr:class I SAM-dependent methyltransferase [Sedimentisphaerales bacterium]
MKTQPEWMYEEHLHRGVDFSDVEEATAYDQRHGRFRDFEQESRQIISLLNLGADDRVIDLGAGTGNHAIHLARHCRQVYAVDVSPAMLDQCRRKCGEAGLDNVECHPGGFLTYEHQDEPVDVIVSQVALHHLPDLWKQIGLSRCYDMLKPGGRLFLADVVFSLDLQNYYEQIQSWINALPKDHSDKAVIHIRNEYSTLDWIMEGMLLRAGFRIESVESLDGVLMRYLCRRPGDKDKNS